MTIHKSEAYIECDACRCKVATVHESWFGIKKINTITQYVEFTGNSNVTEGYHMSVYVKFPMHLCYRCYKNLLHAIKDLKDSSNEKDIVDNSKDS